MLKRINESMEINFLSELSKNLDKLNFQVVNEDGMYFEAYLPKQLAGLANIGWKEDIEWEEGMYGGQFSVAGVGDYHGDKVIRLNGNDDEFDYTLFISRDGKVRLDIVPPYDGLGYKQIINWK